MNKALEIFISPRFCELDGLGHINNSIFLQWFEQARVPLFKIFNPSLSISDWNLIIARTEVDYLLPVELESEVKIKTYLSKIGNSSMAIEHELYQNGQKKAHGKAIMIYYDYQSRSSVSLTDDQRLKLNKYLNDKT